MAGSVNKVILVGNLGRDPEIRAFPSGDRVANFSIATSETWRDRNSGERKERTEWHNIVVRGDGLVKVVENYVKKGSKLYIEGSLHTRKWQDQNGQDRYTTEVVVSGFGGTLTMLDNRGSSDSFGGGSQDYNGSSYGGNNNGGGFGEPRQVSGEKQSFTNDTIDDDIPF